MNYLIRKIRFIVHELAVLLLPKFILRKLLSCEEISKILVEGENSPHRKSFRVKMHILICQCCTEYEKQLEIIEKNTQILKSMNLTEKQKEKISSSKAKVLDRLKD